MTVSDSTGSDAVVVGAGPNGLAAAITLARSGLSVEVVEGAPEPGGGVRTEESTLPGFRHDPCSAVHPLGAGSPLLSRLPLEDFGLEWVAPDLPLAHPFISGEAAVLAHAVDETAESLGCDATTYRRLLGFLGHHWSELAPDVLRAPLTGLPRHPLVLARFATAAALPADVVSRLFRTPQARALLAGLAAHVKAPLSAPGTAGVALLFAAAAHGAGWPFPRGGAGRLTEALVAYLSALGGTLTTSRPIRSWADLPPARAYLFDVSPSALATIAHDQLPHAYRRRLARYRYGSGVYKVDFALGGPVPWRSEACRRAGTVHLGATHRQIGTSLREAGRGRVPDPPFLITAQPSAFDPSRAPEGQHVFWAYAHVPHGWDGNLSEAIEQRIEQFAPGFRDLVLARASRSPVEIEAANPNYVGGDIGCGSFTGLQSLLRPTARMNPYATPNPRIFLCSSATPPGPGVHGMCGYHAARTAFSRVFSA